MQTLIGDKQLLATFDKLPDKVQRKVTRPAVNAASRVVVQEARQRVPRRTGQLRRSLGVKVKTYKHSGRVVGIVGPRHGFRTVVDGRVHDPAKIAHLVEYGTVKAAPKPFLRPASQGSRSKVLATFQRKIRERMEIEAKRGAK